MNTNIFVKDSIITTIIMMAEKIRGRKTVSKLIQYKYNEMIKHSLEDLEQIRDSHIILYNKHIEKLKN